MHTRYSSVYVNGNNPFREHYLLYTLIGVVFFFYCYCSSSIALSASWHHQMDTLPGDHWLRTETVRTRLGTDRQEWGTPVLN